MSPVGRHPGITQHLDRDVVADVVPHRQVDDTRATLAEDGLDAVRPDSGDGELALAADVEHVARDAGDIGVEKRTACVGIEHGADAARHLLVSHARTRDERGPCGVRHIQSRLEDLLHAVPAVGIHWTLR